MARSLRLSLAFLVIAAGIGAVAVAGSQPPVNVSGGQLALRCHDAVAYWTNGHSTQGNTTCEHRWNGALSRFSTAANAWRIVDGRLYLNYSKRAQKLWEEGVPGNIAKGRQHWPGVPAT